MLGKPELCAHVPSFAAHADDVAPRRQPVDAENAAVIRYGRLVSEIFVALLPPLLIHNVKLYVSGDERGALDVHNFAGYNAAPDQREIYLLARLAFIKSHRPGQPVIIGTVGGDEGV